MSPDADCPLLSDRIRAAFLVIALVPAVIIRPADVSVLGRPDYNRGSVAAS